MNELSLTRFPFKIVPYEQLYAFTQNLNAWYANHTDSIPDIYDLFEYPDLQADAVIGSMINFYAETIYNKRNISITMAINKAIEHYDQQTPFVNACLEDVRTGLDLFQLSYQYKEPNSKAIYYNLHMLEVW